MPQYKSSLARAGYWFVQSGIQEPNGGVARYYHVETQKYALISTEITGYAISALVYLYEKEPDQTILASAIRAGRFLADRAWDPDLKTFPFEHSVSGAQPEPLAYFFDCGIIVRGLLSLWRTISDQSLLGCACQAGQSMLRDFRGVRVFHPIVTLPAKRPIPCSPQWSTRPGCYQLKSAMAWHELYELTGDAEFREGYEDAVASALETRGRFLPAETPEKTMDRLHSYCYLLEGLMPFAHREDCRDALREGIDRVSAYLREIEPIFVRSDVYAQLLRIRLYAAALAGIPVNEREAEEEAGRIREFQCNNGDPRMDGGYYFGRKGSTMLPFVNPVSTAFCMQAQEMWHDRKKDGKLEPHILI